MQIRSLDVADTLEKGMVTHSNILAWRISWTEEPDGLQFIGCKELGTIEATKHKHIDPKMFRLSLPSWQQMSFKIQI